MPTDINDYIKEIKDNFKSYKKESFINDYAKIMQFLEDKEKVKVQLKVLDKNLQVRAWKNPKVWEKPYDGTNDKSYLKKILTDELSDCEKEEEFNQETKNWLKDNDTYKQKLVKPPEHLPSGAPTIIGVLGSDEFRYILFKNGYQFKDPGAGQMHGEFSHRIQWYTISKAKADLKLNNELIDLYKELAKEELIYEKNENQTLWDLVFDCLKSSEEEKWLVKDNFRTPECLNTFLCEDEDKEFKLLSGILEGRRIKRTSENGLRLNERFKELSNIKEQVVRNLTKRVIWPKR